MVCVFWHHVLLAAGALKQGVDARHKAGHDECLVTAHLTFLAPYFFVGAPSLCILLVVAGLVPAIPIGDAQYPPKRDRRDKPGDDERILMTPYFFAGAAGAGVGAGVAAGAAGAGASTFSIFAVVRSFATRSDCALRATNVSSWSLT